MATYEEIYANATWFHHEIDAVDAVADKCLGAHNAISCMHPSDWPSELTTYRDAYDKLIEDMAGDTEIGYKRGVSRLQALSTGLHQTAKDYLAVEAANEADIKSKIDSLIEGF